MKTWRPRCQPLALKHLCNYEYLKYFFRENMYLKNKITYLDDHGTIVYDLLDFGTWIAHALAGEGLQGLGLTLAKLYSCQHVVLHGADYISTKNTIWHHYSQQD